MKRVRVCRNEKVSQAQNDVVIYGDWIEATPDNAQSCDDIARAGNEKFGAGTHWIEWHEVADGMPNPDADIRRLVDESMQSWMAGDLEAHTACFTPGAVFINPTGACFRGHDGLRRAFDGQRRLMPGLRIAYDKMQIAYPAQGTAIILMEGNIHHSANVDGQRWASTQTAVLMPAQRWLFASHQVFHAQ